MSAIPEWLEVGQPVAVRGWMASDVQVRTVARFTKTRVVLDDGEWFPLSSLSKRVGGQSLRLANVNNPAVVRDIRTGQVRALCGQIFSAMRDLPSRPSDEEFAAIGRLAASLARKCGAS